MAKNHLIYSFVNLLMTISWKNSKHKSEKQSLKRTHPRFQNSEKADCKRKESATSVATVRIHGGQALVSHRPNQHVESLLGDQPPLKLQVLDQDVFFAKTML